jgi:hypothetical protein
VAKATPSLAEGISAHFLPPLMETTGFCMIPDSNFRKAGISMARPSDNYKLRWRSKKANKGRKPSKGRVKGWSTKHYAHLGG